MARKSEGVKLEKSTGWYRCCVNGKRPRLSKNKREAERMYRKLLADADQRNARTSIEQRTKITVGECCRKFLQHTKRTAKETTFGFYRDHLRHFEASIGSKKRVSDLILAHATEWIDERYFSGRRDKPYSENTIVGARRCVKRCFEWCEKQGWIEASPFKDLVCGTYAPTREHVTDEEFQAVLTHFSHDRDFCDLLLFLRLSGARVQETRVIEAKDIDLARRRVVLENKVNRRGSTRTKRRTIVLNEACAEIVQRGMSKHPDGPIFRNEDGNPWRANAITLRLRRAKKHLGFSIAAKNLRHSWATDYLLSGGSLATGAELMGHSNQTMMLTNYQHLAEVDEHMLNEAERIATDKFS